MNKFGIGKTLSAINKLQMTQYIFRDQIMNRYNIIDRDRVWFDVDRDVIIKQLHEHGIYDIYIITKRGKIKIRRKKHMLKVIALRFRYYKKYMVIVEVAVSQIPDAAPAQDLENEIQTA